MFNTYDVLEKYRPCEVLYTIRTQNNPYQKDISDIKRTNY